MAGQDRQAVGNDMPPDYQYAALDERVHALGSHLERVQRDVHDLRSVMATGAEVLALSAKLDSLGEKIADRSRPQWQVLFTAAGVVTTMIIAIGGLAYIPISSSMNELKTMFASDRVVLRPEITQRWAYTDDKLHWLESRVSKVEDRIHGQVERSDKIPPQERF